MEPDGSNMLRIAYKNGGRAFLADLLMTDSLTSNSSRFLIPKTTPRFIESSTDDSLWLPSIQFDRKTDSTETYYEPVAIILSKDGNQLKVSPINVQQKSYEDLVNEKPLVLQFYKMNEPFYIFLSSFTTRSLDQDEKKRKFYLLILANTNDPTIGQSARKDEAGIYELFSTLTKQAGIGFVPIAISGNAFNIGNANRAIDTIRPAPLDIVLFYYSGHGFRHSNDVSKYPRISFRTNHLSPRERNNLSVEDVYNRLLRKHAKVTIVISDCCNEKIGSSVPFGLEMLRPRATGTEGLKLNYDNFRKLFMPTQTTSIIIGSAAANQLAAGNPNLGGFFTNFFKAELIKSLYSNTGENTWLHISLTATENTRKQSLTALCSSTPNVNGRCIQRAEVRVLPPF
jgi:hypothetical protein